jgi:hypothetical protein
MRDVHLAMLDCLRPSTNSYGTLIYIAFSMCLGYARRASRNARVLECPSTSSYWIWIWNKVANVFGVWETCISHCLRLTTSSSWIWIFTSVANGFGVCETCISQCPIAWDWAWVATEVGFSIKLPMCLVYEISASRNAWLLETERA